VVIELRRVTKPGGLIAPANWTPDGFIGKMFGVFARHLPPPSGLPSPLLWGDEAVVRARFADVAEDMRLARRTARLSYPFDPAGTVEFSVAITLLRPDTTRLRRALARGTVRLAP